MIIWQKRKFNWGKWYNFLSSISCYDTRLALTLLIQSNLNGSNTDGSFTLANSNSFFSPYKILQIAQENKYLGIFFWFIMELYVECTY